MTINPFINVIFTNISWDLIVSVILQIRKLRHILSNFPQITQTGSSISNTHIKCDQNPKFTMVLVRKALLCIKQTEQNKNENLPDK